MGKIISIANQKGGVGKTTTAINLSTSLAHLGYETLLIDMDPQSNATSGLGIDKKTIGQNIYQTLIDDVKLNDSLRPTLVEWLDIAPSNIDLIGAEIELVGVLAREMRLKKALESVSGMYKYIIIDCPPSLGLLTLNALTASDSIIIPIQCEYYALEGLGQLMKTIDIIKQNLNMNLSVEGVLLTMFDSRMNLCQQVTAEVQKYFGEKVFKTKIPRTVKLAEAPSFGKPMLVYDKTARGAVSYLDLAKEFIARQPKAKPIIEEKIVEKVIVNTIEKPMLETVEVK
jgi:chromosome partitioning protein